MIARGRCTTLDRAVRPATSLLHALDLLGVAVFAASGVLAAGRKNMDLLGVVVIAMVTALGGGTLRDLLLDHHPLAWIADVSYLWMSLAAAVLTIAWVRVQAPPNRSLLVADALGLAFFAIAGTAIAEESGQSGIVAVLMGTMTGVAGGVLRDVLCAEVPVLLRSGRLYASAAIAGTVVYLVLEAAGVARPAASLAGMAAIVALRLGAIFRGWSVPIVSVPPQDDG
jgi:uncharacterized membrane protein YeiH